MVNEELNKIEEENRKIEEVINKRKLLLEELEKMKVQKEVSGEAEAGIKPIENPKMTDEEFARDFFNGKVDLKKTY
jgi:hypothetical protein